MNIKNILVFPLLSLMLVSCSGGTGTTSVLDGLGDATEGNGVALDVSATEGLSSIVYQIVVQKSFQYMKDNSMDLEEEQLTALCQNDQYSGEIDREIEDGYSFYASQDFDVLTQARFVAAANGRVSFADYSFTDEESQMTITLDGDVDHTANGEMVLYDSDFMTVFCSGSMDSLENAKVRISMSNFTEGTIALSGDLGGVLAFEMSDNTTLSTDDPDTPTAYDLSGTAVFKSGGNFFDCTISRPDHMGDYNVLCVSR